MGMCPEVFGRLVDGQEFPRDRCHEIESYALATHSASLVSRVVGQRIPAIGD